MKNAIGIGHCGFIGVPPMSQVTTMHDVIDQVDIFVTTTGNKDIIMATDMAKMKNNAIVGNIGHFDNEIDMAGLMGWPGIKRQNIKPQVCNLPVHLGMQIHSCKYWVSGRPSRT